MLSEPAGMELAAQPPGTLSGHAVNDTQTGIENEVIQRGHRNSKGYQNLRLEGLIQFKDVK